MQEYDFVGKFVDRIEDEMRQRRERALAAARKRIAAQQQSACPDAAVGAYDISVLFKGDSTPPPKGFDLPNFGRIVCASWRSNASGEPIVLSAWRDAGSLFEAYARHRLAWAPEYNLTCWHVWVSNIKQLAPMPWYVGVEEVLYEYIRQYRHGKLCSVFVEEYIP